MVLKREKISELEKELFAKVTVDSERTYLNKRISLGAGYEEFDSHSFESDHLVESRENISDDGGWTGKINVSSRYYKLRKDEFSKKYYKNIETEFCNNVRIPLRKLIDKNELFLKTTMNKENLECEEWIKTKEFTNLLKNVEITRQAFGYNFKGTTTKGSNQIEGYFMMLMLTKLEKDNFKFQYQSTLWNHKLTLKWQKPVELFLNNPKK